MHVSPNAVLRRIATIRDVVQKHDAEALATHLDDLTHEVGRTSTMAEQLGSQLGQVSETAHVHMTGAAAAIDQATESLQTLRHFFDPEEVVVLPQVRTRVDLALTTAQREVEQGMSVFLKAAAKQLDGR